MVVAEIVVVRRPVRKRSGHCVAIGAKDTSRLWARNRVPKLRELYMIVNTGRTQPAALPAGGGYLLSGPLPASFVLAAFGIADFACRRPHQYR